jgi:DNA-binding GntR family transcriptional regulator
MYLADKPIAHVTVVVPIGLGKSIPAGLLAETEKPIILILSEVCNIQVAEVDQWTTASRADGRIAEELEAKPGDPILSVQRIFYDISGTPVEIGLNQYRGDRFRHHLRLHRERLGSDSPLNSVSLPFRQTAPGGTSLKS